MFSEEGYPVVSWHHQLTILCPNQLCHIHICRCVDDIHQVQQAADEGLSEPLLQQSEAPVWSELCVPDQHEGHGDGPMETGQDPPCTVLQKGVVLPGTVVRILSPVSYFPLHSPSLLLFSCPHLHSLPAHSLPFTVSYLDDLGPLHPHQKAIILEKLCWCLTQELKANLEEADPALHIHRKCIPLSSQNNLPPVA